MSGEMRKFQYYGEEALQLPAKREAFATLKEWLLSIAEEMALPARNRKQLLIAADEIFTNIASYGYPSGEGTARVSVAFDMEKRELILTFSDTGIAYNPLEVPAPDLSIPLAEREAGGLGIFLVRKLMDSVEYRRENGCNVLILKKAVGSDGRNA